LAHHKFINTAAAKDAHKNLIEFNKFELENGLKVILSEDHSIPTAAINLCYHVGSKDEELHKTGFAHLFEHLMYEGSVNVPKGDYERLTTFAGGENNAYTTEDKTNYYLLLPSNQLELGLWLESDRMLGCAIGRQSLATQKKVVIEEKKQNYDNRPYGTVSLEFAPRLFPHSSYAWDTIGDVEDIKNAKLEDVRDFFGKYYTPNNAVLSISGSFDTNNAIKLIEKYFGGIKKGVNTNGRIPDCSYKGGEIQAQLTDKIQFPGIFIAYRIPKEDSEERFAFELLSEILSTGDSSRLYKSLVYEKQMVSETGCWADCKEHAGAFYLYAISLPGIEISAVENEIENIINETAHGTVSEDELQKAKNRIETKSHFRRQYILTKADMLAHYETFYNNPGLINSIIDKYSAVSASQILKFSEKYLKPENRVTLIYLPEKN
jgi:predicted Zn-dependent peptidase